MNRSRSVSNRSDALERAELEQALSRYLATGLLPIWDSSLCDRVLRLAARHLDGLHSGAATPL